MIESKKELDEYINLERTLWIRRNYPNNIPKRIHSKELSFVSALRHVEYCSSLTRFRRIIEGSIYGKVKYKILSRMCNVMIPINVFGKGLLIMHLQNIVISSQVKVGEYCCLFHNVTLGIKLGNGDNGKCPVIGNGVTICCGAGVFGDVYIADEITVGANAVVTKRCDEKQVVLGGIPAKIIGRKTGFSMIKFKNNIIEERAK